ncbi:MAG: HD domain-containing protein [Burkholderiaceae bacterium]|nr:HD domain-containing protein [Burkholderiaceae bacterium]
MSRSAPAPVPAGSVVLCGPWQRPAVPPARPSHWLEWLEQLFLTRGKRRCMPEDKVDLLSHSLQCAQLAEWAHADAELVAAAFLHDVGHLLPAVEAASPREGHERRALPWLTPHFGEAVTEPMRLHVQAKRYLVGFDRRYLDALSPAALHGLSRQGGPMSSQELRRFEREAFAPEAIRLRVWDDLAQHPGKATPPLAHYLGLLEQLMGAPRPRAAEAAPDEPRRFAAFRAAC